MKNKIIKSTVLLIFFGIVAKILSMLVKIVTTRIVGLESMSIFSLIAPLMVLIITLSQQGIPLSIAKLVAANPHKRKKIIMTAYALGLFFSGLVFLFLTLGSSFLANTVFHNPNTKLTIMATGVLAPLIVLTSFYKGYLVGMEKIAITSASQIFEEVGRIIFIILFASYFVKLGPQYGALGVMVGILIGEVFQMISLVVLHYKKLHFPTKTILKSTDLVDFSCVKDIYSSSVPLTLSRLVTSLAYTLEPIIITKMMLQRGFDLEYITINYGILQTYVMPIIFLPGFFASAFSTILLPNMSKLIASKDYIKAKTFFYKILFYSFVVAVSSSALIFIFSASFLKLMFNTDKGLLYIRLLAFPCILYYIEAPLSTAMHSLSLEKQSLLISIIASTLRVIMMFLLVPHFEIIGVEIAMLIAVSVMISYQFISVRRKLNFFTKKSLLES